MVELPESGQQKNFTMLRGNRRMRIIQRIRDFFSGTTVALIDAEIVRRVSPFNTQRTPIVEIIGVLGRSRDAITHDEYCLVFQLRDGKETWVSEFDRGYHDLLIGLQKRLPGFDPPSEESGPPLSSFEQRLWRRVD